MAENTDTDTPAAAVSPKALKQATYNSLWRLKRAIERDGYYSARIALNVWRSNAVDAGMFDQDQYDQFKQQIYEKAIQNSLTCFERSLEIQNLHDANMCLHIYKIRSQEIDQFDPVKYAEMKSQLASAASNGE